MEKKIRKDREGEGRKNIIEREERKMIIDKEKNEKR